MPTLAYIYYYKERESSLLRCAAVIADDQFNTTRTEWDYWRAHLAQTLDAIGIRPRVKIVAYPRLPVV